MILFFFLLSLLSLIIVNYGFARNQKLITNYFLSATVIRLLLSIIFALVFIYLDRENNIIFAVNFIVLYLVFLGFDISSILAKLAARSENKE